MKKVFAVLLASMTLTGCHYLGAPEAYTVVDEERAPIVQVAPVQQPIMRPAPMRAPMMAPATNCGCNNTIGACQVNPGVKGPIEITIPAQKVCIQQQIEFENHLKTRDFLFF